MPYVSRNAQGVPQSLHREPTEQAFEWLDEDDPDVIAFLGGPPADADFSRLDADFVRVIEDLIDVLLRKHVFNVTDLPAEAQAKLFTRKRFRETVAKNSLQLFGSDSGDII